MKKLVIKPLYLFLGSLFLLLAILGIFLPLLPTTPFAILSVYFFSRSSTAMHMKVLKLPVIGPAVLDWEDRGVIRTKSKITVGLLMLLSISIILIKDTIPLWGKGIILLGYMALGIFIYRRPSS